MRFNQKSYLWLCALGLIVFSGLFTVARHTIIHQINQNKEKICTTLQQELGFSLSFQNIHPHWFGLSFGVLVDEVKIIDSSAPIPFVAVDKLGLVFDLKQLLFKQKLQFKTVILQGLRLVIGQDNLKETSILGLKGESIPNNFEYAALMQLLRKQPLIVIKDANIEWRTGNGTIQQWLQGELQFVDKNDVEWILAGEQQLKIREGLTLPAADFKISTAPLMRKIAIELQAVQASANCAVAPAESGWGIDCALTGKNINLSTLRQRYVADPHDSPVLHWLANALQSGVVNKLQVNISGPIQRLKWTGELQFSGVDCLYAQHWPKLERTSGLIKLENDRINVRLSSGKMMGVPIESAVAVIKPDEIHQEQTVFFEGSLTSTLEKGLLFLKQSPLRDTLGIHPSALDLSGLMHLKLNLQVPLTHVHPVQVEGIVSTRDARLDSLEEKIKLTRLSADCHFTERGLAITDAQAFWQETPFKFSAKTIDFMKHPGIEIIAQGKFNADELYQAYPIPVLKKFKGESMFAFTLRRPLQAIAALGTAWELQSDLAGMSIELPQFLGKASAEARRTTLTVSDQDKETRLALNVENRFDAKWVLDNVKHRIKCGDIVLGKGKADWNAKSALMIRGELDRVNVREWYKDFSALQTDMPLSHLPDIGVDVLVQALDIYGLELKKTWVSTTLAAGASYPWVLEGPVIKGNISFRAPSNVIDIDLDYLKIANKNVGNATAVNALTASQFLVSFACQDLQYEQSRFGATSFTLHPKSYGYDIQDLKSETAIAELAGNGEWHIGVDKSYTQLQGRVISTDMGAWFSQLGYASAIQDPSGYIDYQFKWEGEPFRFSISRIDGVAELKFDKGRILGIKPGLGRIMGLLNIASIKRRLQLDFSDVFKQGFVFDIMRGTLSFKKGTLRTEQLLIDGPSAKIELSGSANVVHKEVDLTMKVTPHIGMGVPIMAAIAAGNPMVGAGVWVIDKLTGSKIKKMTRHNYQVTGTWDAPKIQELDKKTTGQ